MNFDFTEEQNLFRDASRKFLQAQCPTTFVRELLEQQTTYNKEFWLKQLELGWTSMLIPEAYGGIEMTLTDMIVVAEEIGRVVMPGPFYATTVTGVSLLTQAGNEEQKQHYLTQIAAGNHLVTLALLETGGKLNDSSVKALAAPRQDKFSLSGEKLFVPDAQIANTIIVAARTTRGTAPGRGISLFLIDAETEGLHIEQMPSVDLSRRICKVTLDNVVLEKDKLLGDMDEAWPVIERAMELTHVAYCCELVGLAEAALEMVVEYLKIRVQFGKAIGTFQALQHRCADMMVHNEMAKSLSYYACYAVEKNLPEASVALAMAAAYCSETAKSTISDCIQLFGGIGFTWEHDIHLYQRRAISLALNMGTIQEHREKIAKAFLD